MKNTVYGIWMVLIYVLQTTLVKYAAIYSVKPSLIVIFIAAAAVLDGPAAGGAAGFILGALSDLLFGSVNGLNALLLMYAGIGAGLAARWFVQTRGGFCVLLTAVFTLVYETAYYVIMNVRNMDGARFGFAFLGTVLPETAYNAALCLPIFLLFRAMRNKVIPEEFGKKPR